MDALFVVRSQPRFFAVVLALLALLALGTAWVSAHFASAPGLAVSVVSLAVLAALAWSLARRWDDRVEFHADHLVDWRAGRSRRVALDDVTHLTVRFQQPQRGFSPDHALHATLAVRDAEALSVRGEVASAMPALRAVGAAIARRLARRLEAGETLYFEDDPRFPLSRLASVVGLFLLLVAGLVGLVALPVRASNNLWLLVRLVGVYGVFAVGVARAVRQWWRSRRSRGLAVSAQGIRPLSEVERRAVSLGNYRTSTAAMEPWIPWSDVVRDTFDGYGLTLDTASRDEPVVLTDSAENLLPLHQLLTEHVARARRDHALTGVRVELPARPFGAPPEEPAEDPALAAQRRR